jgi:hypothetical protein
MPEIGLDAGIFVIEGAGEQLDHQVERLLEWSEWIDRWNVETVIPDDLSLLLLEVGAPIYHDDLQDALERRGSPYSAVDIGAMLWRLLNTSVEIGARLVVDATVLRAHGPLAAHGPCHPEALLMSTKEFMDTCSWLRLDPESDFYGVITCTELGLEASWTSVQEGRVAVGDDDRPLYLALPKAIEMSVPLFMDKFSLAAASPLKMPPIDHSDAGLELAIYLEALRLSNQIRGNDSLEICFTMSDSFGDSIRKLHLLNSASESKQLLRACAEAVLEEARDQAHRMRVNSRGGSSYRRSPDGRFLNRRYINVVSGLRLHSWDRGKAGIELSTVAVHDDFNVPDPQHE